MANYSGINPLTPRRLVLDAGAIYRDYGLPTQRLMGATRGGATFTVEREDRQPEIDGIRGRVKGLSRVITHNARLEVTFVEMSLELFLEVSRGTSAVGSGATVDQNIITPGNEIVLTDYADNIALVASVANSSAPVVILLKNALQDGEWSITTGDQTEGELPVTWYGHYEGLTGDENPPYEIRWPVVAS